MLRLPLHLPLPTSGGNNQQLAAVNGSESPENASLQPPSLTRSNSDGGLDQIPYLVFIGHFLVVVELS